MSKKCKISAKVMINRNFSVFFIMKLFSCNYYNSVTIILVFLNSMTVFTAHHKRQGRIFDGKKLMGLSIEDFKKTFQLYNKVMEDPSAYYESVSRIGHGQNTSALIEKFKNTTTPIETLLNKSTTESTTKGIVGGLNNTEMTSTPTKLNYEFLLQELNRKIKNLTIPLSSLTTVEGEEMRSSVSPGVEKITPNSIDKITPNSIDRITPNSIDKITANSIDKITPNSIDNFTTDGNHYLNDTSSTIGPITLPSSPTFYSSSNPSYVSLSPVFGTTQNAVLNAPTNISGLLENQKDIIKQLMINIDAVQKVLTTTSQETTTEFRLSNDNETSLNRSNGGPINDISTILLKLAEVESNATINMGNDQKPKSKNPFTALMQRFLKTKNFDDMPQI